MSLKNGRPSTSGPGTVLMAVWVSAAALIGVSAPVAAAEEIVRADPAIMARSLKTSAPVRLVLKDGAWIIGRVLKVDEEGFALRRGGGGVRRAAFTEIDTVELKDADGRRIEGVLTGWSGDGYDLRRGNEVIRVEGDVAMVMRLPAPVGGPLVTDPAIGPDPSIEPDPLSPEEDMAALDPDAAPLEQAPVVIDVGTEPTSEGDGMITFRLTLSAPAEQPIAVIYSLLDGSALGDQDYGSDQGVIVFKPGNSEAEITVVILDDDEQEEAETFRLFLSADPAVATIGQQQVSATILDDDDPS